MTLGPSVAAEQVFEVVQVQDRFFFFVTFHAPKVANLNI